MVFNKVEEIRVAIVNEVNELGETALFIAAEKGYLDVVKELLPYTTKEGIKLKNRFELDPLHVAANRGHEGMYEQLSLLRILKLHLRILQFVSVQYIPFMQPLCRCYWITIRA